MRKKYIIWNALIFCNFICCYSQIVNNGILHISDSTIVYFENEYTNKGNGTLDNHGNLYLNNNVTNVGAVTPHSGRTYFKCIINPEISISDLTNANNLEVETTAVNLFQISSPQNNRLTYLGQKTRLFQINASFSQKGNSEYDTFFISKNGSSSITETNTLIPVKNTLDKSNNYLSGSVELALNEYIEIWRFRQADSDIKSINVCSLKLSLK